LQVRSAGCAGRAAGMLEQPCDRPRVRRRADPLSWHCWQGKLSFSAKLLVSMLKK